MLCPCLLVWWFQLPRQSLLRFSSALCLGMAVSDTAARISRADADSVFAHAAGSPLLVSASVRALYDTGGGWVVLVSGTGWPARRGAGFCRVYCAGRVGDR